MEEFVLLGLVITLGLGAYWSLVIFPRQREFQKQQKYVQALKVGDEMITYGGIIGRIIDIDSEQGVAQVEIADGITIRMLTASLIRPYDPDEIARHAQMGLKEGKQATTPSE